MEKLKKIAKNLDKLFQVLFWVLVVGASLVAVIIVIAMFMGSDSVLYKAFLSNVDFGNIQITPTLEYCPKTNATLICRLIMLVVTPVSFGLGIVILRRILKPMTEARPFDGGISKNIRNLGILTLISGFVLSIIKTVCVFVDFGAFHVKELFNAEKVSQVVIQYRVDLTFVVVAVVLFLLSLVFRYGEELQQLSDETL